MVKKKISPLIKNKRIFIPLLILLIVLLSATTITVVREISNRFTMQLEPMSYEIKQIKLNKAQTVITFYDEDGLKSIETPNNTIYCSNRNRLAVDYEFTDRTNYKFIITDNSGDKKTIDLFFEIPRIEGDYVLNKETYAMAPYVKKFEKGFTRYLYQDSNGNLVPGEWITGQQPTDWYDYTATDNDGNKSPKWANVYVESNGKEIYYVWIPRYCYKLSSTGETTDVLFISTENEYKYLQNGEEVTRTWDELQQEGYKIPEAFWWDKNDSNEEDVGEQLPGYWTMKYVTGIFDETYTRVVNYDMGAKKGKIFIKNLRINNDNESARGAISYCEVALNGIKRKTIEDIDNIDYNEMQFDGLIDGDNYLSVIALTENGEIVGSMTQKYEYSSGGPELNAPDISKFNKETTFYVTWDEDGTEHSDIPLTQPPPENWYQYADSEWANVVTRNNDTEVYYVWIPRYEYKVEANEKTTVKFIIGTSTQTDEGYKIPEAFWWDKNNDGIQDDDEQLTGYWVMKYVAGIK